MNNSKVSRRVLNKLAKIHLANMIHFIELDNDNSRSIFESECNQITDDETFNIFQEEFKKEKNKIIDSLEKRLGFALPEATTLVQVFNLYKEIEGK
jgi:hypothetical protein